MFAALLGFLAAVVVMYLVVSRRPAEFTVSRTDVIEGTPEEVFAEVNDLRRWQAWSPWAQMDPGMQTRYEGPDSGVGAKMHWSGNQKVGAGSMEITESEPCSKIDFTLVFLRPMKAVNIAEFVFEPVEGGTQVTWAMYGKNNFLGKAMSLVMNMDKLCGDQFIIGLANLNRVVKA